MTGFSDQWWYARKRELMAVAAAKCPVLIYNEESLNDTLFDLMALGTINALFYPVHVNPHPKILRKIFEMGGGFQCNSAEEMNRLFTLFPKINPETVLFAPETVADNDLILAFACGAHVLVHDTKKILEHLRIFQKRQIFLTLAPDIGEGSTLRPIMETLSSRQISLAGFSIRPKCPPSLPPHRDSWVSRLVKILGLFPKSTTLLLRGELAVVMDKEKSSIDIPSTGERLEALKNALAGLTLWLEPGSGVVSGAGVLLARVLETTEDNGRYIARTNLPADPFMADIYLNSYRHLVNLSRMQEEISNLTRVSGQEIEAHIPMEEGDILLFTNVGACGKEEIFGKEKQSISEHYLNARKMCPVKI